MEIRKAVKKDLKEIAELFRIETSRKPYSQRWNKKSAFENIKNSFEKHDLFIVISNKRVIGFILSYIELDNKNKAYVDELWVRKKNQGQGIGSKLMKFIEKFYLEKGVKMVQLVTSKKKNGAFYFYKKIGYEISDDTIFMKKKLNERRLK